MKRNTNPTAATLAMRDPAKAAIMGAFPTHPGANFGKERVSFGSVSFGDEDDVDMGVEFGLAAPPPPPAQLHQMWASLQQQKSLAARRGRLLEPNKGSHVKVERYNFNLNQAIVIGTAAVIAMTQSPATNFRPQRVTSNAPQEFFVMLSQLQVSNVNAIIGGQADAYQFNANGQGQELDLPTLTPAIRAIVSGSYTGSIPPQFGETTPTVQFTIGMNGPATVYA